jgi:hypothetical protein
VHQEEPAEAEDRDDTAPDVLGEGLREDEQSDGQQPSAGPPASPGDLAAAGVVAQSGFELEEGQLVVAFVGRLWRHATVFRPDRTTVTIEYFSDSAPPGPRQQRVSLDRVRVAASCG